MEATDERLLDERLLYVPVRPSRCGSLALRTGRLASGQRIGLAFTSRTALAATLGPEQEWIRIAGRLVPRMFAETGAVQTRVDPQPMSALVAARTTEVVERPVPATTPVPTPVPVRRRRSLLRTAVARHAF